MVRQSHQPMIIKSTDCFNPMVGQSRQDMIIKSAESFSVYIKIISNQVVPIVKIYFSQYGAEIIIVASIFILSTY